MAEVALPHGTVISMDPIREDLRELKRDLKEDLRSIKSDVQGLVRKLDDHIQEDADAQGRIAGDLGVFREKLSTLSNDFGDRSKFVRNWVFGLIAVAIAATVGFLFRSAIDAQVKPATPAAVPSRGP
jgi:hypothetical protein